jgi:hypothetical protein
VYFVIDTDFLNYHFTKFMKILWLLIDTFLHVGKIKSRFLSKYKVAKFNVNGKPSFIVIGPVFRG